MDIRVACLIGNLIDAVSSLNGSREEKMAESMRCDGVRIRIKDSVDLATAQSSSATTEKQIRAINGRAV